ncbi:hypothetical protein ACWCO0_03660 [Streptomyces tubercidicus]
MTSPEFLPSHVVPPEGMASWSAPDTTRPSAPLDPLLPVQIVDRRGDWALAMCSNGWSTWVDGRLLLAVPREAPAAAQPAARTADPRPLLGAVESDLSRYRKLIEELAAGQLDGESFGRRTRGTRLGVVVDGDALWLYDARHERWCYCDGVSLQTYAVTAGPSSRSGERQGDGAEPEASEAPEGPGQAAGAGAAPSAAGGPAPAPDPQAPGPPDGPSAADPGRTRAMQPGERPPPPPNPVGEIR